MDLLTGTDFFVSRNEDLNTDKDHWISIKMLTGAIFHYLDVTRCHRLNIVLTSRYEQWKNDGRNLFKNEIVSFSSGFEEILKNNVDMIIYLFYLV